MHFCADELFMLMAAIPFLGAFIRRLHAWYLNKFPKHGAICHDHREAPGIGFEAQMEARKEVIKEWTEEEVIESERPSFIPSGPASCPPGCPEDVPEDPGPLTMRHPTFDELVRPEDLPSKFFNKKNNHTK